MTGAVDNNMQIKMLWNLRDAILGENNDKHVYCNLNI